MQYRKTKRIPFSISAVTFGVWGIGDWLWGGSPQAERLTIDAIGKAVASGVTTIDTAATYGLGGSEYVVGKAIRGIREKVQILTKFGQRWDRAEGKLSYETTDTSGKNVKVMLNGRPDSIVEECEQSLKRLNTDYIDLYQCHWPDPTTPIDVTMQALSKLLQQGKIRAVGVCNYTLEQLKIANSVVPIASIQMQYSMLNRSIENDILPWCIKNNVAVMAYSPLQRGVLSGAFSNDFKFRKYDDRVNNPYFIATNLGKINNFLGQLKPIADKYNSNIPQIVMSWTLNRKGVVSILSGAGSSLEIIENAKAADIFLTSEENSTIERLLDNLDLEK